MDDKTKHDISTMIAGILHKKYGEEMTQDVVRSIVDASLDQLRLKISEARAHIERLAMDRLHRRFASEVEPMLQHFNDQIEHFLKKENAQQILENLASCELTHALREKAQEWARKVTTSQVRFSFDKMFED